jgi:Domain of unknown function (DUF4268)
MPDFGTLRNVDLRQIWSHEASSFTPWLADNIEALGEAVGMELELTDTEADVGDFSLDLLAKDLGTGRNVSIENQLTATDHDHLGKLITYASAFDAAAVIWVAQAIRDEHRQALEWLNQRTSEDTHFFGVVIEVFQIDNSKPAPRGEAYRRFFQTLIDDLREKHKFTTARVGQPQNWYAFSSGVSGVPYGASFAQGGRVRVDAYIDLGDSGLNKALFDKLLQDRADIEAAFGEPLEWERLDLRRACRIASYFPGSINTSPGQLEAIRKDIIDRLLRLKKALGPTLRKHTEPSGAAPVA